MILREEAGGLVVFAPAKLNLFLEVLGRRPDGYHELETLMVTVNLHDKLSFRDDASDQITLTCDDPTLPCGADNLVVKAAQRLKASTGCTRGVSIALEKVIPAQAGLAGGSSDAAATLVALDRLWDLRLPGAKLDELAAEVGSDVAFFRHGPAAVCRGRGELVEPVALRNQRHFVLVRPTVGISTADVYRNLVPAGEPRSLKPCLEALAGNDNEALGRSLFNRLQSTAERLCPAIERVRQCLLELIPSHLDGHLLSGSGSAYFGLARDLEAADDAAKRLESLGLGWVRVVSCGI